MPNFEDDLRAVIYADTSDFKKGMAEIKVLARDTGKEIDTVRLKQLSNDLANLQIEKKKLDVEFRKNQALYDKGLLDRAKLIQSKEALNAVSSAVTETGRKLQNLKNTGDENLSRLQKKFNDVGGGADFLKSKLKLLGPAIALLGPVIAGAFGSRALLNFINQLEMARSEIIKATGASGKSLKEMQGIARDVFNTVPESIDVVGKAIGEINTRFGATGDELRFLTKDFLDFARITGQDVNSSVRDVSRFMADMGIEASRTSETLDKLVVASQISGVSIGRLTDTSIQYGVQLRALGFDLDTSIALLSKFEKEGVSTEKIFSGLSQALGRMAKEGISDPAEGFKELTKRIEEAGTVGEATRIAIDLLGTRAGPDFALAVLEGRFEIEEYTKALSDTQGALSDTAKASLTTGQRAKILGNQFKSELIPAIEFLLPVLQKIIDFTPKVIGGFKILYISIIGYFVELGAKSAILVNNLKNNFSNAGLVFQFFGKAVAKIFGNIVENIGIAFGNIGPLIGKGLNSALTPINSFFNSFINTYDKTLGKLFGKIGGKSNLSINFGDTKQLKGLSDGVGDIFSEVDAKISKNNANIERKNQILEEAIRINRAETRDKLFEIVDEETQRQNDREQRRIDTLNNSLEEVLDIADEEAKGKANNDIEKEAEELLKAEQDRIKKLEKFRQESEEKIQKQKVKNAETLKDAYEEIGDVFDDEIKKSEDAVKDFTESIQDLKDDLNKLKEESRDISKDFLGFGDESRRKQLALDAKNFGKNLDSFAETDVLAGSTTGGVTVEELRKFVDLQNEQTQNLKDQEKAKQEIQNLELQKGEEEAILRAFNDEKIKLDETYQAKKLAIEKSITDSVYLESQKRISALEAVRQKALATAESLRSAGVSPSSVTTTNNTSVNVNASISNDVDLNKVGNYIANELTLANKGIK